MLRNLENNDWFTTLILVCLVLIAVSKLLNFKRFNDLVSIFTNSNYLKIYIKEQKFINLFDGILFLNLIISLTIFSLISLKVFKDIEQLNIDLYFRLIVGLGCILLIKVLIDRLIGSLFEVDDIMNSYIFQKITYKNFIGLILLPINIILIYSVSPYKTIIYLIILLIFIVNLIGFATSLIVNLKVVKNNFFYFILYLCALEIAPYIILFKVI